LEQIRARRMARRLQAKLARTLELKRAQRPQHPRELVAIGAWKRGHAVSLPTPRRWV
jgi:hypothetical protein